MSAQVLVLGIGNQLLGDDGVGITLMEVLAGQFSHELNNVEFIDGGTQGLALLGLLENRKAVLILDAISLGRKPGTVHVLSATQVTSHRQDIPTAHGSSARELLNAALLLGQLPPSVTVVGIEPSDISTRIGLSDTVRSSVEKALTAAADILEHLIHEL